MGDEYNDKKRGFEFKPPQCKECKKKDRVPCPPERSGAIIARLEARMKNAPSLSRAEIDLLKIQRKHAERIEKGDYCRSCVEKMNLWIQ